MDMDQIPEEILRSPLPPIPRHKYDWSLAQPHTKLITTSADGVVVEWSGDITSDLNIVATSNYVWLKNPHNGFVRNSTITCTISHQIKAYKGDWLASVEMRPVVKKPFYAQGEFLGFIRNIAHQTQLARREFDMGVAPDDAYNSPFLTPESIINDKKVKL